MLFCSQKRKSFRVTVFSNKTIRHLFLIIIIVSVTIFFMTYNDLRVSQLSQPFQIRRRILADRTILQQYDDAVQQISEWPFYTGFTIPPLKEREKPMDYVKSNPASQLDISEKHLELIDRALSSKKRKHSSLNRSRSNKYKMESKQTIKALEGSLAQISENSNKLVLKADKQPEDAEQTLQIFGRLLTHLGDLNKTKDSYKPIRSIGKPHEQRADQIENDTKNENIAHAKQLRKPNQILKVLKGFVPGDKAFNLAREIGDTYTTTATKTKDNIYWQRYNKTAAGHAIRLAGDETYRIDTGKKLDNEEVIRNIRNYQRQQQKNMENEHNRQSYERPHGNAKAVKANNTQHGSNWQHNNNISDNGANASKMGNNSKRFHWPLKNNKLDDGSKRQNNSGQLDNKVALNGNTRNAFYKSIESNNSIVDTYNAQHNKRRTNQAALQQCHTRLHGSRIFVNEQPTTLTTVEKQTNGVSPGGHYSPKTCTARSKMAIIVPYRDRTSHLNIFLRHMHKFLHFQEVYYTIFVVELAHGVTFNRGALLNIGFLEAKKRDNFDCFIFHDVDLLPEDTRNLYSCTNNPRHMSSAIDVFQYRLPYDTIFGGVSALTKEQFEETNGYSNLYFGWGGEDDDFYRRIIDSKMSIARPFMAVARYKMISHKKDDANRNRFKLLESTSSRRKTDGLNSLKYTVLNLELRPLFTWIHVTLNEKEILSKYQSILKRPEHISIRKQRHFQNEPNQGQFQNIPVHGMPNAGHFYNMPYEEQFQNSPNQGQFQNIQDQGSFFKIFNQGLFYNMPNDGQFQNVPNQGQFYNMQNERHFQNIPNQGQFYNMPNEGQFQNVPNQGQFYNMANKGQFNNMQNNQGQLYNMPNQGQFYNMPNQGQFNNMPNQGQFNNMPNQGKFYNIPNHGQLNNMQNIQGQFYNMPNQGHFYNMPNQGQLNNMQNIQGQFYNMPNQGQFYNMPNKGHLNNMPNQGQSNSMPNQGHSYNMPNQGQLNNMPNQGQFHSMPNQAQFYNLPNQGKLNNMHNQGQFYKMPNQGQFYNMPDQGQFNNMHNQEQFNKMPYQVPNQMQFYNMPKHGPNQEHVLYMQQQRQIQNMQQQKRSYNMQNEGQFRNLQKHSKVARSNKNG